MAATGFRPKRLTPATLAHWPVPKPGEDADKEDRGHVLIVAGSVEMPDAALLAAVAALRAGAGKLTIAAPAGIALGLAFAVPEAARRRPSTGPQRRSSGARRRFAHYGRGAGPCAGRGARHAARTLDRGPGPRVVRAWSAR